MIEIGFIASTNKNKTYHLLKLLNNLSNQRNEKYFVFTINDLDLISLSANGVVVEKNTTKNVHLRPLPKLILNTVVFRKQESKKIMKQLRMQEKIILVNPINKFNTANIYEIMSDHVTFSKYILEKIEDYEDKKIVVTSRIDSTAPWYFIRKINDERYLLLREFSQLYINNKSQRKLIDKLLLKKYDFYSLFVDEEDCEIVPKRIYCQKKTDTEWVFFDRRGSMNYDINLKNFIDYLKWYLPGLANCYIDILECNKMNHFFLITIGGWDSRIVLNKKVANFYIENALNYASWKRGEAQ